MTFNDLECPIHLKVRFTDGTLDVRTLWLSDSTIRIGVARGEWAGGPSLPSMWAADALFLCGRWASCYQWGDWPTKTCVHRYRRLLLRTWLKWVL